MDVVGKTEREGRTQTPLLLPGYPGLADLGYQEKQLLKEGGRAQVQPQSSCPRVASSNSSSRLCHCWLTPLASLSPHPHGGLKETTAQRHQVKVYYKNCTKKLIRQPGFRLVPT